ncbi:MAG: D-glucuronyl C5-epimerase family protein [Candidatus Marinimicrobia bacterium]|nr:D-glucuronyl C5-epimerase family protein [Candidatus Neomarinimicrobiota bacterium]
MKKLLTLLLFITTVMNIWSCGEIGNEVEIVDNNYSFIDFSYDELFYTYPLVYYQIYEPFKYDADSNGVILASLHGDWYYNPVSMSQRGINLFDRYKKVEDSLYLDYAIRHRDALINIMDENCLFEYRINWHHRLDIFLWNPWYSGMAQGQALSLFSRLAYYANDSLSQNIANEVYQTLNFNLELSREVVWVGKDGYAWIEEYPANPPDHTFNGFMFAIIGIYDYYHLLNKKDETRSVLSSYLTTIKDNMKLFRNPGTISYYCLRHHHSDTTYHKIHIQQLDYFTKITNDSSFSKFADTLRMDYWNY